MQPDKNEIRFAKFLIILNGAVPLAMLLWDAIRGQLGANPVNFAIRTTGMMTLIFLPLSLLVTPLRKLTGWNWLLNFRRALGLYAFFYALCHFSIYFIFDRSLSVSSTLSEIASRVYLMIGTLGLAVMVPLAVTSTNGMVKWLGSKKWHLLHRLAYVAAIAGAIHYYLLVKADVQLPIAFASVIGVLLGYRGLSFVSQRSVRKASPGTMPRAVQPTSPGRRKFWSGTLKVARIFQETPQVKTFRFVNPVGGLLPFEHQPGQYLNLALEVDGKTVRRSYTIASSPSRQGYCEITVKREDQGEASRFLHDRVREGDLITLSAPAGSFTFNGTQAQGIVLLGGGVGITPLMSVIRYLTDIGWTGPIRLIHSVRTDDDRIFEEELAYLRRRHANLSVVAVCSQQCDPARGSVAGRISADLLRQHVPALETQLYHICGPDPMMTAMRELLKSLGVAEERIRVEAFTRPAAETSDNEAARHHDEEMAAADSDQDASAVALSTGANGATIHFASSGRTVTAKDSLTVLEIAEECDVAIDFECRSGICGTCRKRLLSGQVTMEVEDGLTASDRKNNVILTCQAIPLGPVSIDA